LVASKNKRVRARTTSAPKGKSVVGATGKNLVIVESPGKIKTISKVLGKGYVVKASVGHVRDLTKSKKGDTKTAIVLGVAKDFTPTYMEVPARKKVLDDLRKAAQGAEKIYLCPDPDREGEAIAWHLKEALELEAKRTFRVTFDEITPRAIKSAFDHPREINMDLVNAQQARRVLDRIVGYKLSPLLWEKIARGLSAGRVQSVAVRLIVEREREIDGFQANEYWTISASFAVADQPFEAELRALDGRQVVTSASDMDKFKSQDGRQSASGILRTLLSSAAEAEALLNPLRKSIYVVQSYDVKEVQDRPYPPFATSQLQQAAANRLGYDARRTMRVAQRLYEGVPLGQEGPTALITYMRTDSFRIAPSAVQEAQTLITRLYGNEYLPEKPNFYSSRKGAQEAHECIRPTHIDAAHAPESIQSFFENEEQFRLYKLIWERFLASQMKPAVFDATTCDIAAAGSGARGAVFRATGRVVKFDGWIKVYGGQSAASHVDVAASDREKGDETTEPSEEDARSSKSSEAKLAARKKPEGQQVLPAMRLGDKPKLEDMKAVQHYTQALPRYTEASLVKTLEREGIGRPSTYAAIISTIQDRGYVEKIIARLDCPRDPTGLVVVSGSATGRVIEVFPASYKIRTQDGFECIVPKDTQLFFEGKQVTRIQEKGMGGRGAFRATAVGGAVTDGLMQNFSRSVLDIGFTRLMEAELDKIEEAHLDWRKVLQEFYKPFAEDLAEASKGIKATKGQGEKTDVKCPECGEFMEKRLNRFGYYLRCSKAADCKGTLRLDDKGNIQEKEKPQPTGLTCDKCQADVVKAVGRFGPYFHCVYYADQKKCTFTMKSSKEGLPVRRFPALPTELVCEKCKKGTQNFKLVVRVTSRGKVRRPFLSCSNFPKCRAAQDMPPELKDLGELAMERWRELDAKNRADQATYQATISKLETVGAGET